MNRIKLVFVLMCLCTLSLMAGAISNNSLDNGLNIEQVRTTGSVARDFGVSWSDDNDDNIRTRSPLDLSGFSKPVTNTYNAYVSNPLPLTPEPFKFVVDGYNSFNQFKAGMEALALNVGGTLESWNLIGGEPKWRDYPRTNPSKSIGTYYRIVGAKKFTSQWKFNGNVIKNQLSPAELENIYFSTDSGNYKDSGKTRTYVFFYITNRIPNVPVEQSVGSRIAAPGVAREAKGTTGTIEYSVSSGPVY